MRYRDGTPHSPKRPYMFAWNSIKTPSRASLDSSIDKQDAEQIISGLIPSLDRIQNGNKNAAIQEEPSIAIRPVNTNVNFHLATSQEKPSSLRHGLSSCRIPCAGTLLKILIMYGFIATGIGGYLLRQFFRIPSLQNEVNQLSKQVDRLQSEIIALNTEIQSLTKEIDRLDVINEELSYESISLKDQVHATEGNLIAFNATIDQYEELIANLTGQNILWKNSSSYLNNSVIDLSHLNQNLNTYILSLNASVLDYETKQVAFIQEIYNLTYLTSELNQSVIRLANEVISFQLENTRLQTYVSQLGLAINSLDNTTVNNLNLTLTANVAVQQNIAINRNILLQRLHTEYRTLLTNWDCDILGRFALKDFVADETLAIGSASFPSVFNYLNNKLMGYMCMDTTDFQSFMINMILPSGSYVYDANLLSLKESVMRYSNLLLQYYFPTTNISNGLNSSDWEKANYQCSNLTSSQRFVYGKMISQYYPSSTSPCIMQTAKICTYSIN